MTEVCATIWNAPHNDPTVRAVLDRVRPQIAQLHVDPLVLEARGPTATANLRLWYPGMRVWWGVPGDGHGPDPTPLWLRAVAAAARANVDVVVLDCEGRWKDRPGAADIARGAVAQLHDKHPSVKLGFTSYDTIEAVGYKDAQGKQRFWGGHSTFPWKAFLGPESPIALHFPQVYAAGSGTAPKGALQTRDRRSRQSLDRAIVKHTIRAPGEGLSWQVHLQAHHTPTDDLVAVARGYKIACFWATPTRCDEAGIAAMELLAREHDAMVAGKAVGAAVVYLGPEVECDDDIDCHPESTTVGEHC